jgi:hypothetical protein
LLIYPGIYHGNFFTVRNRRPKLAKPNPLILTLYY